jgi:thioredoxin-dependent peroxiredoxin
VIIGISVDTLALQQKFTDKENLPYPLLADNEQKFATAYGVLNPKNKLASRATFVIAKDGTISKIYSPVSDAKGHPEQVLEYVKATFKK